MIHQCDVVDGLVFQVAGIVPFSQLLSCTGPRINLLCNQNVLAQNYVSINRTTQITMKLSPDYFTASTTDNYKFCSQAILLIVGIVTPRGVGIGHSHYWPNYQIPECTCSISQNASFRTEICTCLFCMEHSGIWDRCILRFVNWYIGSGNGLSPCKKIHLKMSSAQCRPFCFRFNVLIPSYGRQWKRWPYASFCRFLETNILLYDEFALQW